MRESGTGTGAEPEAGTGGEPPNRAGPHRPDRDRKPEHSAESGESPPRDGAEVGQRKAGAGCKNSAAARRFPFKIFSPRSVRKKSYAPFSLRQRSPPHCTTAQKMAGAG